MFLKQIYLFYWGGGLMTLLEILIKSRSKTRRGDVIDMAEEEALMLGLKVGKTQKEGICHPSDLTKKEGAFNVCYKHCFLFFNCCVLVSGVNR